MKLKEKTTATLLIAISMMILVIPVMAAKPTYDEVFYYQTQFQWRGIAGSSGGPFGSWSKTMGPARTSSHYRLTGNVLHSYMEYNPTVFGNPEGMSHVFVNDGDSRWIIHEGQTSYTYAPFYGPYRVVNYFRGYIDLSSAPPTDDSFVKGVLYQWAYVVKPQTEPVQNVIPYAEWDPVMDAWLIGFSIYLQYPTSSAPTPVVFTWTMSSLPRPVPASNYNPLGL